MTENASDQLSYFQYFQLHDKYLNHEILEKYFLGKHVHFISYARFLTIYLAIEIFLMFRYKQGSFDYQHYFIIGYEKYVHWKFYSTEIFLFQSTLIQFIDEFNILVSYLGFTNISKRSFVTIMTPNYTFFFWVECKNRNWQQKQNIT